MLTPGPGCAARRAATTLAAGAVLTALALAVAHPARADQARQRQQWVLNVLHVPAAWRVTQGNGVVVAVIDSGVDPSVSDLTGSVLSGPDYTGVRTPVSNPNWGAHGTWMASLIAGHGHGRGAGNGILGVAPRAKILSIRVITDRTDPGYSRYQAQPAWRGQRELASGIRYAVRRGAGVISMSLGYDESSLAVRSALQYAYNHNVVVVASSGNAGMSHSAHTPNIAPYSFPADYPGVIGVAAVTQSGQPAYFSSENLSVSVAAPGVNVPAQGRGSKYWIVSGTSPACALTAGVAALIKAKFPQLTAAQVRSAITRSTAHRPHGGYNDHVGFGTVDAAAALRMADRLAGQVPGGNTRSGKAAATGNFGNGQAGVPAFPVPPRGRRKLLEFLGVGTGGLLLVIIALVVLIGGRRKRKVARRASQVRAAGPPARPGTPGAGGVFPGSAIAGGPTTVRAVAGGPVAGGPVVGGAGVPGASGSELDVRYPTQIFRPQPHGQALPIQGYLGHPGQGLPVQGYLGQPGQAQFGQAGQAPQVGPAQQPGQPGSGQPGSGQPGSGQPGSGQPGSGQPGPPPQSGYGFAGAGYPGPGYSRPGQPGPGSEQPSSRAGDHGQQVPSPADQALPPTTPAGAGESSQDEWLFEDEPSQPAPAGPGADASRQSGQQSTADPQTDRQQRAGIPWPGRRLLPAPEATSSEPGAAKIVEDPLTSPRYSRQNLPRDEGQWRAFRSDWLTRPEPSSRAGEPERRRPSGPPDPQARSEAAEPLVTESARPVPAANEMSRRSEPVMRSVWEPLVRNRPVEAATPADQAGERAGSVADASVGSTWATSASATPGADLPRRPDRAAASPSRSPDPAAASPSPPPAERGMAAADASANAGGTSSPDSAPQQPLDSEPLPHREPRSGAEPLPRRQPMTHLAAPLRRDGRSQPGRMPQAGHQEQTEAAEKLPSVWDTWRPAAAVRRAAQAEVSESGDETT